MITIYTTIDTPYVFNFHKTILFQVWDEELALMAQKWAGNCQNFHDANANRVIPGKYNVTKTNHYE